jgi:hypothetical protein
VRGIDKLAAQLRDNRELAMLYKVLATLRVDCPIVCDVDALEWKGVDQPALDAICNEIGLSADSVKV